MKTPKSKKGEKEQSLIHSSFGASQAITAEWAHAYLSPDRYSLKAYFSLAYDKSFTPYKDFFHILRDLGTPLYGVWNILFGIACFGWHLVKGVVNTVINLFEPSSFADNEQTTIEQMLIGMWDASLRIGHGIMQIFATPLAWLIRFPARTINTMRFGWRDAEDNASFVSLVKTAAQAEEAENPPADNYASIISQLHLKLERAKNQKQRFRTNESLERAHYSNFTRHSTDSSYALKYLGLFSDTLRGAVAEATIGKKPSTQRPLPDMTITYDKNGKPVVTRHQQPDPYKSLTIETNTGSGKGISYKRYK